MSKCLRTECSESICTGGVTRVGREIIHCNVGVQTC